MHDLFAQTTSSPEDAARFLDRARNTTPGVLPLDAKKLKRTRREIRNRLRRLHSTLSDRYGFKLDISLSDIAGLAAVWSVLFLISGYLYTSTLLNALGVRASIFLGISDYVASSVDQIRYAGFATAWGAFTYLLGAFSGTRKSVAQTRAERPLKERNRKAILALILTSAAASLWMYFFDKDNYFEYAKNTGALASMFVADMIATRAFKQPLQAAALLTAVFSFAIYMFAAVGETIYKFDSGKWKPLMNARVILRSPTDTSLSDTRVFGAAGNYLILVHMPSKKVVLVPRDRIEQVDIEPNE
jgi:hypothetical protein